MEIKPNNIYLGDANELIKHIEDKSVNIIYTDIPYLYQQGGGGSSEVAQRIRNNAATLKNAGIVEGIDYNIFNDFVRVLKKINVFIWCSKLQLPEILNWWLDWSKSSKRQISYEILVYCKANPTPSCNNKWLPDLEYCLYFRESGVKLNDGYHHKHKFYYAGLNVADKNAYGHPTCKPLEFVEQNLEHVSQPGDVVLDPYLGSGTTALAARHLNLNYIGFEIAPEYFKIAKDRLDGWDQNGNMNLLDFVNSEGEDNDD